MITLLLALALAGPADAPLETTLRAKDQALLDAIAPGDRALWERTLADDAIYVDENGTIMDRQAFLTSLVPLPHGVSGSIAITDYRVQRHGDSAFVIHRDEEREMFHGQALLAHYLMTETWRLERNEWKLASAHVYVVNDDPPAIALPAAKLAEYTGRYQAAPDLRYVVRIQDGKLMGGAEGGPLQPLLAEATDVLFLKGQPRKRLVFQRDGRGAIAAFAARREGHDVIWTRLP
ncbi:DUF4440 domain-containing protein [Dyella sp. SG609]|uniref:nuclear transport factor 2 family protein n=1 Tax=Dyella sp. SG609 TaxID=2587018 RepID=UPI001444E084|nr:DUF4440 domain-containing protein [Dyella sp. SG609]NKJ19579.1 ketosteroid isomerase-like protein [Dyella sp. SG609]